MSGEITLLNDRTEEAIWSVKLAHNQSGLSPSTGYFYDSGGRSQAGWNRGKNSRPW